MVVVAGTTLYVAGQQGPANGKLNGVSIEDQTANTIAAIQKVVEKAGFQMTDLVNVTVFITDLNDCAEDERRSTRSWCRAPSPRALPLQVAGLIGGAKIEISAIAVKQ